MAIINFGTRGALLKKKLLSLLPFFVALATLLLAANPARAHHGTAGYDLSKSITLTGTVTRFAWTNPHMIVELDAKDDSGNTQHWKIELAAPLLMSRFGWSKNSMVPGDHIVAEIHPAKNGALVGLGSTASMPPKFTVNGTPLTPPSEPNN